MPRIVASAFCLFLGAAGVFAGADTVVEGTVELPPASMARILNQRYAASPEAPLAPTNPPAAVVYLEGNFTQKPRATEETMAQKNMLFAPDLVAIPVGGTVAFPNLDDTYHNVFSYSKTKRFDLGRYRKNEKPATVVFDRPGVITVHCEIHDRMRGTVLVLSTPYFIKTDSSGHYRLEHLPSGQFVLKAWVSEADVRQQNVELKSGATLHVDFHKS